MLIKKYLNFFLVFPWILLFPVIFYLQIGKLELGATWNLDPDQRRIFFVKQAFRGIGNTVLPDEYFTLLAAGKKHIPPNETFSFRFNPSLGKTQIDLAQSYAEYWLRNSLFSYETEIQTQWILSLQKINPLDYNIVEIITGSPPSFVLRKKDR